MDQSDAFTDETVPDGFAIHTRSSPAIASWEPLWVKQGDEAVHLGFFVRDAHCNSRDGLHGGVIATLADNAMGLSLARALARAGETATSVLTTSLALDFVGSAGKGSWVEIVPSVVHRGSGSGVVAALVTANAQTIARANASFRFRTAASSQRQPE